MAHKNNKVNHPKGQRSKSNSKSVAKNARGTGYFEFQLDVRKEEKRRVAEYVCKELVKDGDSIVLDAGSSPMYIAEILFTKYRQKNISILTHNMEVFKRFRLGNEEYSKTPIMEAPRGSNIQLALTGGEFSVNYNALFGIQTESAFKEYFPRLVILAVSGLICSDDPEYLSGLYCHATAEMPVKKLLFTKATDRRVVVADWTKLGKPDSFLFGELNRFNQGVAEGVTIVTTTPPKNQPKEIKMKFDRIVQNLRKRATVGKLNVVTLDQP